MKHIFYFRYAGIDTVHLVKKEIKTYITIRTLNQGNIILPQDFHKNLPISCIDGFFVVPQCQMTGTIALANFICIVNKTDKMH